MEKPEYATLMTEQRNDNSCQLDTIDETTIVSLFLEEERAVDAALRMSRAQIARGIAMFASAFSKGRIFMVGAGTSGRLAVLEAAECPPTFGTAPDKIVAIMAGGNSAVFQSQEGAEDDEQDAPRTLRGHRCSNNDLVIGIAASGITRFVHSALGFSRTVCARSILITCNPDIITQDCADLIIGLPVGAEILTGSTRLKAGTACKRVLNILTTGAMARLGKIYQNLMVDVQLTSDKLRDRALRIVCNVGGVDAKHARYLLDIAGSVKVAIVMARLAIDRHTAEQRLQEANGMLRHVIEEK